MTKETIPPTRRLLSALRIGAMLALGLASTGRRAAAQITRSLERVEQRLHTIVHPAAVQDVTDIDVPEQRPEVLETPYVWGDHAQELDAEAFNATYGLSGTRETLSQVPIPAQFLNQSDVTQLAPGSRPTRAGACVLSTQDFRELLYMLAGRAELGSVYPLGGTALAFAEVLTEGDHVGLLDFRQDAYFVVPDEVDEEVMERIRVLLNPMTIRVRRASDELVNVAEELEPGDGFDDLDIV